MANKKNDELLANPAILLKPDTLIKIGELQRLGDDSLGKIAYTSLKKTGSELAKFLNIVEKASLERENAIREIQQLQEQERMFKIELKKITDKNKSSNNENEEEEEEEENNNKKDDNDKEDQNNKNKGGFWQFLSNFNG